MDEGEKQHFMALIRAIARGSNMWGDEVALTEEQLAKCKELAQKFDAEIWALKERTIIAKHAAKSDEDCAAIDAALANAEEPLLDGVLMEFDEVILPHQMKRIQQLALQGHLRMRGQHTFFGMLAALADHLDLTRDESRLAKERLDELEKEYKEKLTQLQQEYIQLSRDAFPKRLHDQIEELIGDTAFDIGK